MTGTLIVDRTDVPHWVRLRLTADGRILLGDGDSPVHMGTATLDPVEPRIGAIEWTEEGVDAGPEAQELWQILVIGSVAEERHRRAKVGSI
jgi:hypothetical protein